MMSESYDRPSPSENPVVAESYDRPLPPETLDTGEPVGQTPKTAGQTGTRGTAGAGKPSATGDRPEPIFHADTADEMRQRWHEIQATFVDDPRDALRRADELTGQVLKSLSTALEDRRNALEHGVTGGDTEQLRIALRQYRLMLDQVLAL